jgi:uncharacterized protein (UPF0303 family)
MCCDASVDVCFCHRTVTDHTGAGAIDVFHPAVAIWYSLWRHTGKMCLAADSGQIATRATEWRWSMADQEQELQKLLREEEVLQFTSFTNDTAFAVGLRIVEAARTDGLSITVDICRNGQQLFHCALPGTSVDNDAWIERKNRVVNHFGHSSYYVGVYYASKSTTLQERALLDPTNYAAHGGGFPVLVKDVGVVGTITVSGLPQQEDHALVVRVLADYLGVALER